MDVASLNEIKVALKNGCKPENIVFSNTVKEPEALRYARKKGIFLTTADDMIEIDKIKSELKNANEILWRIKIPTQTQKEVE
jgi:diaminopimelate decarboxylase